MNYWYTLYYNLANVSLKLRVITVEMLQDVKITQFKRN